MKQDSILIIWDDNYGDVDLFLIPVDEIPSIFVQMLELSAGKYIGSDEECDEVVAVFNHLYECPVYDNDGNVVGLSEAVYGKYLVKYNDIEAPITRVFKMGTV